MNVDLRIEVERIPEQGRELVGTLEAAELQEQLDAHVATGYTAATDAEVQLHVLRIDSAVRLTGRVQVQLQGACSRCLEPIAFSLAPDVDLTLFPADQAPAEASDDSADLDATDESIDDDGGSSTGTYSHGVIEAATLVRELLLLELPMSPRCHDDCAGLCDMCGHNLNHGPCQCVRDDVDPRWAGLKDIKVS